ncbi:LOW QUALITY PROTEIN: hypothetical protein QTO34_014832 [Cnephaeus nilssonii]|uniref:Uncharacterized protein n=1 Tax=Cnephaeus nilssonii TaxID=3371016 RepID=A0AA40LUE7_CNENI|nr:LOW QUALITY PROTEIN: hypothetical protein QTO34_014832 [Eptesicus nilssonii]
MAASTLSVCSNDMSYGSRACLLGSYDSCTDSSWQVDDCQRAAVSPPAVPPPAVSPLLPALLLHPSCCTSPDGALTPCLTLVCTPVSCMSSSCCQDTCGTSPCQSTCTSSCTSSCTPSCCQQSSCQPSCWTSSPCQQACCVPVCCTPVCSSLLEACLLQTCLLHTHLLQACVFWGHPLPSPFELLQTLLLRVPHLPPRVQACLLRARLLLLWPSLLLPAQLLPPVLLHVPALPPRVLPPSLLRPHLGPGILLLSKHVLQCLLGSGLTL